MKLCRFESPAGPAPGLRLENGAVADLRSLGVASLAELLERADLADLLLSRASGCPIVPAPRLLSPVDQQEVWAAGVTYLRSKKARMDESEFSASAYDRVYEAPRPELFFKAQPFKVVGPGGGVGIRKDAKWNVPEPELALVISSQGKLVGFTIGNDMSSRDIEGENLLYLPQAKTYRASCALGPSVVVGASEAEARSWKIGLTIMRGGQVVFQGETSVGQIKRSFEELIGYLWRSQEFPHGAILLTGTGVVPPDGFTLAVGDHVAIEISGIGRLENTVIEV